LGAAAVGGPHTGFPIMILRKQDVWPLGAIAFLLTVTGAWWALALWPLPAETPVWLERTRSARFNTTESGLPDASGWILLVGEPLGMAVVLFAGWRARLVDSLRHLGSSTSGRVVASATVLAVVVGLGASGMRVLNAGAPELALVSAGGVPDSYPRLDRPWPEAAGLVDQTGAAFTLDRLGGRRALVTFAYAHCETICPLVVRSSIAARDELADEADLAVVALTLDPWRDTPSRFGDMAGQWRMAPGDFVVGGDVASVEAALDLWGVPRSRDERTGDLAHPALVFLVDADGTVAYASTGAPDDLVALARRLR